MLQNYQFTLYINNYIYKYILWFIYLKQINYSIFFKGDDDLTGIIEIKMNKIKKFEHTGIRVELVGHIGKNWLI